MSKPTTPRSTGPSANQQVDRINVIEAPEQFIKKGDKVSVQIREGSSCKGIFRSSDVVLGIPVIIVDTDDCYACIVKTEITAIGRMK
jgi:hypothetical protein